MFTKIHLISPVLALIFSISAQATQISLTQHQGIRMHLGASSYKYEEPNFMDISGVLYEISGSYTIEPIERLRASGQLLLAYGTPNYDGGLQDGTPLSASSNDFIANPIVRIGYSIFSNSFYRLTPRLGLAYRYLFNKVESEYAYTRVAQYYYMPLGTEGTYRLTNNTAVTANLEYFLYLGGRTTADLGDVQPGLPLLNFEQKKGKGYRIDMKVVHDFGNFVFEAGPFYEHWKLETSEFDSFTAQTTNGLVRFTYVEPENFTHQYGLTAGIRF